MDYGFVRVGAAVPRTKVADCKYNATEILNIINEAEKENVEILLFPELCLTSCSCGDLYCHSTLLKGAEDALRTLLDATKDKNTVIVVGAPVATQGTLLNCAVVIWRGGLAGVVPQNTIPTNSESSQRRWFSSTKELPTDCKATILGKEFELSEKRIFSTPHYTFAIEF